eukprot:TRINITY_DN5660_c1_g2_i2.p1 TRINITY_DN5660_c1_g2~~TRINITY_DN5660_c1_g2_i2.p1  ORF type:complete len:611 (+),score=78.92 TRINITY_DN5660_c1_g2_i2:81-1835(+)
MAAPPRGGPPPERAGAPGGASPRSPRSADFATCLGSLDGDGGGQGGSVEGEDVGGSCSPAADARPAPGITSDRLREAGTAVRLSASPPPPWPPPQHRGRRPPQAAAAAAETDAADSAASPSVGTPAGSPPPSRGVSPLSLPSAQPAPAAAAAPAAPPPARAVTSAAPAAPAEGTLRARRRARAAGVLAALARMRRLQVAAAGFHRWWRWARRRQLWRPVRHPRPGQFHAQRAAAAALEAESACRLRFAAWSRLRSAAARRRGSPPPTPRSPSTPSGVSCSACGLRSCQSTFSLACDASRSVAVVPCPLPVWAPAPGPAPDAPASPAGAAGAPARGRDGPAAWSPRERARRASGEAAGAPAAALAGPVGRWPPAASPREHSAPPSPPAGAAGAGGNAGGASPVPAEGGAGRAAVTLASGRRAVLSPEAGSARVCRVESVSPAPPPLWNSAPPAPGDRRVESSQPAALSPPPLQPRPAGPPPSPPPLHAGAAWRPLLTPGRTAMVRRGDGQWVPCVVAAAHPGRGVTVRYRSAGGAPRERDVCWARLQGRLRPVLPELPRFGPIPQRSLSPGRGDGLPHPLKGPAR